jgi:hypothetical protein
MIRRLIIENFKSFRGRHELELAPITLIFGPNSAGKSTLIQSILLLKQTLAPFELGTDVLEPRLVARGDLVDLGSFQTLIHGHDTESDLRLGLEFTRVRVPALTPVGPRFESDRRVEFVFGWNPDTRAAQHLGISIGFGDQLMSFRVIPQTDRPDRTQSPLAREWFELRDEASALAFQEWVSLLRRSPADDDPDLFGDDDIPVEDPALSLIRDLQASGSALLFRGAGFFPRSLVIPREIRESLGRNYAPSVMFSADRLLRASATELTTMLSLLAYLGPLRSPLSRLHELSGQQYASVGPTGENAAVFISQRPRILREVNAWFKRLGIPYSLSVAAVTSGQARVATGDVVAMTLRDKRSRLRVSAHDVGFGISQLLPIVIQVLTGNQQVTCIEQPEIHLHPALQAELGDLFVSATRQTRSRQNQVIVETHSEHLMLRVQRLVREGSTTPDDVAVIYVDADSDGRARPKRLRLDNEGNFIDEWPGGFFDERLAEMFPSAPIHLPDR